MMATMYENFDSVNIMLMAMVNMTEMIIIFDDGGNNVRG